MLNNLKTNMENPVFGKLNIRLAAVQALKAAASAAAQEIWVQ
jgi:hypothetical protein